MNHTRGNASEVSLLRRPWCAGELSRQVFEAEIITAHKDEATLLSLGRGQGCLSSQVSGI